MEKYDAVVVKNDVLGIKGFMGTIMTVLEGDKYIVHMPMLGEIEAYILEGKDLMKI